MILAAVSLWEIEQDLTGIVNDIFYKLMDKVIRLLTTNPKVWAQENGIWGTIEGINNSVITIACQLAVIFFLIGFCEQAINVKENISLITFFGIFIRIAITEYFIVHSLDIIYWLFEVTSSLVGLTNVKNFYINQIGLVDHIYDMNAVSNVVFLFPTIIYLIVVPACGAMILIMALKRLFKIYLAVPYGSLAFSTIASSSREISQTMPGFVKYMLSVLLEAFSLAVALQIGMRLLFGGQGFIDFSDMGVSNHLLPATLKIAQNIINAVILTVICHMSESVGTRALRLDR